MSYVTVANVSQLTDNVPLAVDVEDLTIAIVRHGGKLYAIEDECSHANVALSEGDVEDGAIECYLHGARFELATGKPLSLPATRPVRVFPARIEGDNVQIDTSVTTTDF